MERVDRPVSLFELIRSFMEFASEKGKTDFPPLFCGARPWHEFFYNLKDKYWARFPELACIGDFDWDVSYPTLQKWHELQISLCISEICAAGDRRIYFCRDSKRPINHLAGVNPALLEAMFQTALETSNFFLGAQR